MAKDSSYFVRLNNPRNIRRIILEDARDVIKILQGYEEFKRIREARNKHIISFKTKMDELRTLVNELKRTLPKANVKEIKRVFAVQEAPKELGKIESELADIEEKLSNL